MLNQVRSNSLTLAALVFPIVVVFENKLTPVFLILILVGAVLLSWPPKPRFWTPLLILFGLFIGWTLLTALWSIDSNHSLARFGRLSVTVVGGALLCGIAASREPDNRRALAMVFALGFLIASLFAIFVPFSASVVPSGPVATVIMEMPLLSFGAIAVLGIFVTAGLMEMRPVSPLLPAAMLAAAVAIVFRGNGTSSLALAAGILGFAAVFWLGRKAVIAMAVALPLLFAGSAIAVHTADIPARAKAMGWTLDNSFGHRLIIWRYVYGKALERPILGWGLHTSRIMPDRESQVLDDPRYADILEVTPFWPGAKIEKMPMHPHNATLQTWLELGVIGTALYALLYGFCLWAMSRIVLSRTALASGAGGVLAVFVIGQLSFSAWQSWWLCVQFLAAAFFLIAVRKAAPPAHSGIADEPE